MSVTLTERERLRAEFNRLNSKAWAEVFRTRVEAVQRANPGMSFETAWDKFERGQENPPPEPTTIGEAAKLVQAQNPTWTFERSWHHAEAVHHMLSEDGDPSGLPPSGAIGSLVNSPAFRSIKRIAAGL